MDVTRETLVSVVESIFDTLLDVQARASEEALAPPAGRRCVSASVNVFGSWDGTVALCCAVELVQEFAAIMFDMKSEELSEDDLRDALGELANMTAGSYKSMIASSIGGECELGLPTIAVGSDLNMSYPGTEVLLEVPFTCRGHCLTVTVMEKSVGGVSVLRESA